MVDLPKLIFLLMTIFKLTLKEIDEMPYKKACEIIKKGK